MRAAAGLADLLRTMAALPPEEHTGASWRRRARALGLREVPVAHRSEAPPSTGEPTTAVAAPPAAGADMPLPAPPFWRAVAFAVNDDDEQPRPAGTRALQPAIEPLTAADLRPPAQLPSHAAPPIEPWSRLWPRLAPHLARAHASAQLDEARVITRLAGGRPLERIPYRSRRAWSDKVVLLNDVSPSQAVLFEAQDQIERWLGRVMGTRAVERLQLADGPQLPAYDPAHGCYHHWGPVEPGTPLLLLSLAEGAARTQDVPLSQREWAWRRLGRQLRDFGYRTCALVALPEVRTLRGQQPGWAREAWEQHAWSRRLDSQERFLRRDRLLTLAAPALVISPALLRELRGLLGADGADMGTELDVWRHPDVDSSGHRLRFLASAAERWLERFAALDDHALKLRAWSIIRRHQAIYGRELNQLSALRLLLPATRDVLSEPEREQCVRFALRLPSEDGQVPAGSLQARLRAWFRAQHAQLPEALFEHPEVGRSLRMMARQAYRGRRRPEHLHPWIEQDEPVEAEEERPVVLVHRSGGIAFGGNGSPLVTLAVRGQRVRLRHAGDHDIRQPLPMRPELHITTARHAVTLQRFRKPAWATAMGRDHHGLWVSFEVKGVAVRMRWIPPGTFEMGSPESEPERMEREGPVHTVVLTRGFWLGETPCTQALWTAVMGDNPSYFKSASRPVESVSFEMVVAFMGKLNERAEAMPFRLPSEAEWEYACRAGSAEATYAGPMDILGDNHAPVLDDIAWYGGNSGDGFELNNGFDSSDWPQKQYPHTRAGTRPVGLKQPNAWGLTDMLGNVWEWCRDGWYRQYDGRLQQDTCHLPDDEHADRVVRGGSWNDRARHVRAACRYAYDPSGADGIVGFRLARGQGLLSVSVRSRRAAETGGAGPKEGAEAP